MIVQMIRRDHRAHRTLRDRRNATPDDDGERFEFEAGDYLIDNVEARKAARYVASVGADVLETTLLEKSLSSPYAGERRDTCIRTVQEMRDQQKTMMKVLA